MVLCIFYFYDFFCLWGCFLLIGVLVFTFASAYFLFVVVLGGLVRWLVDIPGKLQKVFRFYSYSYLYLYLF